MSTMKHDRKFKQTYLAYFGPIYLLCLFSADEDVHHLANKVQLVISCCISSPTADVEGVIIRWWAIAAFYK